jgi:hypothetical protein
VARAKCNAAEQVLDPTHAVGVGLQKASVTVKMQLYQSCNAWLYRLGVGGRTNLSAKCFLGAAPVNCYPKTEVATLVLNRFVLNLSACYSSKKSGATLTPEQVEQV